MGAAAWAEARGYIDLEAAVPTAGRFFLHLFDHVHSGSAIPSTTPRPSGRGPMTANATRHRSARTMRLASVLCAFLCPLTGCGLIVRQATIGYIAVNSIFAPKHIEIEIHKSFIEAYKNRVGIHTTFTVDKAMGAALPAALDGDLHFAGRAPQVALPIVAEITNAKDQQPAISLVHAVEGTGKPVKVSGVWRIWPEHTGKGEEDQGMAVAPIGSDNPDHVFEIHPVTQINDVYLLDSYTPVNGFKPGGAQRTFGIYEKAPCALRVNPKTVTIVTETGLYNDVEFTMELADEPQFVVSDGRFVIAAARDLDGKLLVPRLRMVFTKGTPPERAVRLLKGGDRLHVYGIPRLDLAEISRRVRNRAADSTLLTRPLPYEILVLGVYAK